MLHFQCLIIKLQLFGFLNIKFTFAMDKYPLFLVKYVHGKIVIFHGKITGKFTIFHG